MTPRMGRGDERGITLILFTLTLTVLLVFVALAIDTGLVFNEHRQDQSAVDSASLAAIKELADTSTPDPRGRAVQAVFDLTFQNTRTTNGSPDQADWEGRWLEGRCADPDREVGEYPDVATNAAGQRIPCISFASDNTRVRVKLPEITVSSTFGPVVGIDDHEASAAAEAEVFHGEPYAVFGAAPNCDPPLTDSQIETVDIGSEAGSPTDINGTLHSNEEVDLKPGVTADLVTFVAGASPGATPNPPRRVGIQPDPLVPMIDVRLYRPGEPKANSAGPKYKARTDGQPIDDEWFDTEIGRSSDGTLVEDGVLVYSNGGINLTGQIKGQITFVNENSAASVRFSDGDDFDLTPWDTTGLLVLSTSGQFCNDDDGINLVNVGGRWDGIWYAPRGGFEVTDPSPRTAKTFEGQLVAHRIDLEDAGYTISQKYASAGPPAYRLYK